MAVHEDAARFYSVLQDAQESSRTDAGIVLPVAEQNLARYREIVAELRRLLTQAEADLQRWAVTAAELRAARDGTQAPGAALGGKALAQVAVTVLQESGRPQPVHYRDWLELVELAGYTVAGVDPQATFLSAIGREKRIEPIGGRTGLWRLTEEDAA